MEPSVSPELEEESIIMIYPKSVIRDFSCKKLDYSRLFHRYSIYILTQYASFILFQDKMKAKFSNDRFGFMQARRGVCIHLACEVVSKNGRFSYFGGNLFQVLRGKVQNVVETSKFKNDYFIDNQKVKYFSRDN